PAGPMFFPPNPMWRGTAKRWRGVATDDPSGPAVSVADAPDPPPHGMGRRNPPRPALAGDAQAGDVAADGAEGFLQIGAAVGFEEVGLLTGGALAHHVQSAVDHIGLAGAAAQVEADRIDDDPPGLHGPAQLDRLNEGVAVGRVQVDVGVQGAAA